MVLLTWVVIISAVTFFGDAKPLNIVFIVADDLGWNDVGWHNPAMKTPHLDSLAREGVILNSSYVMPVCTPSRTSFMTGYFPYRTGLQHLWIDAQQPSGLPLNFTLLPQRLGHLGYTTHIVGKWHLGFCKWNYTPTYRGFDTFYGYYTGSEDYYDHTTGGGLDFRDQTTVVRDLNGTYSAFAFAKRASQIIESHDPSKPLFLYLPFQNCHTPLEVPQRFQDMYRNIEHESRRIYCGMVSALDEAVGNVTAALMRRGYMENTLIIFTTDNGGPTYAGANNWPLRGAKTTYWEGGTKGAAFVWGKMLKKNGYTNTQMIHAVDWFPTILSLAGGSPEPGIDGINQWEVLSMNQTTKRTEFVYNIDELSKQYAIRWNKYKLIVGSPGNYNSWYPPPTESWHLLPTEDNRPIEPKNEIRLYNIRDDPTEHHDLSSKLSDVVIKLLQRLNEYLQKLHPAIYPKADPHSDPKYWLGTWSPGWC